MRGGGFRLASALARLGVNSGSSSAAGAACGAGRSAATAASTSAATATAAWALVWSSLESRRHDCDNNHERPDRVRAAASKLESDDELASICRRIDLGLETSTAATKNQQTPRARAAAEAVHSRAYLSRLQALCDASAAAKGPLRVADEDDETEFTYVTETSLSDALAAVEAALSLWDLVDDAPSSSPRAGLALVRPPGHHAGRGVEGAEPDSPEGAPSGFCLVNTAAAVARAVAAGRAGGRGCSSPSSGARRRRVLVIDWDVHVGDGTQDIFWGHARGRGGRAKKGGGEKSGGDEPCGGGADGEEKGEEGEEDDDDEEESVCVIDLHEAGAWPGGGGIELRGHPGSSSSRVVNVPLPPGSGDAAARAAFERVVVPFAARFRPEAIVVSAGFDAHELEPLAGLRWTDATYAFLGAAAARLAESHGPGCGLLFVLEGGYSRRALRSSVFALAKGSATLEVPPAEVGERDLVLERQVEAAISAVVEEHGL